MTTFYLDPVNGNDASDGSSWANAWKTWASGATAARIAPGDTIRIAKTADEVSAGINATFTNKSATLTLASALTKDICNCDSAWTASANVTQAQETVFKIEGSAMQKFTFASGFSTGKAAYFDLGESIDFSAYEQISLIIGSSADIAAGVFQICLCSDAAGDTPVDSLTISQPIGYDGHYSYYRTYLTIDKGSALGSSIRSIALYALSDPGTPVLYLDNIIACNGFSLNSVVGKAGGPYWPIRCITGDTTVTLGIGYQTVTLEYVGASETVGLYYKNPVPFPSIAISRTTDIEAVQDSGTSGSVITFSGGWNTSTTEQDGETLYDGLNGLGYGFSFNAKKYVKIEKLGCVRTYRGFYSGTNAGYQEISDGKAIGYHHRGVYFDTNTVSGLALSGTMQLCGNDYALYSASALKMLQSTATIYAYGGISLGGYSNQFNGTVHVGSSETALKLSGAFDNYFKDLVICGTVIIILSDDLGANNLIGKLTLDDDVPYVIWGGNSVGLRIGLLDKNTHTINRYIYGSAYASIWCGYCVDILEASNRWLCVRPYGTISDQITGGQNAAWAYGGEGTSLYLNPNSQTLALPYAFYVPVTAATTYQIHFQVKKTSSEANCTLEIDRLSGCGITEIRDESVSLTDSWAEHTSASFTPAYSGYVRCEIHALDGSTTGDIGIDDIHLAVVS